MRQIRTSRDMGEVLTDDVVVWIISPSSKHSFPVVLRSRLGRILLRDLVGAMDSNISGRMLAQWLCLHIATPHRSATAQRGRPTAADFESLSSTHGQKYVPVKS